MINVNHKSLLDIYWYRNMSRVAFLMLVGVINVASPGAMAYDNITVAGSFSENDPVMVAPTDAACAYPEDNPFFPGGNPYVDLGTFEVTEGFYNFLVANEFGVVEYYYNNISVSELLLYKESFDPQNPNENLVLTTLRQQDIRLEAGTYQLVALYCHNINDPNALRVPFFYIFQGHFTFVIRSFGDVTGIGSDTPGFTYGFFSDATDIINEGQWNERRYIVSPQYVAPATGDYLIMEVFEHASLNHDFSVYQDSYDPENPSQNFVSRGSRNRYFLEEGKAYVIVNTMSTNPDYDSRVWQIVMYEPGTMRFNARQEGAWGAPGVPGQGLMFQSGISAEFLFFAWFTFEDAISAASLEARGDGIVEAKALGPVGSADQRWLTGYGVYPESGDEMPIKFENSTGGIFGQISESAITDSDYGEGVLTLLSCERMRLSYNLKSGQVGEAEFVRLLPDYTRDCARLIQFDAWEPISIQ